MHLFPKTCARPGSWGTGTKGSECHPGFVSKSPRPAVWGFTSSAATHVISRGPRRIPGVQRCRIGWPLGFPILRPEPQIGDQTMNTQARNFPEKVPRYRISNVDYTRRRDQSFSRISSELHINPKFNPLLIPPTANYQNSLPIQSTIFNHNLRFSYLKMLYVDFPYLNLFFKHPPHQYPKRPVLENYVRCLFRSSCLIFTITKLRPKSGTF